MDYDSKLLIYILYNVNPDTLICTIRCDEFKNMIPDSISIKTTISNIKRRDFNIVKIIDNKNYIRTSCNLISRWDYFNSANTLNIHVTDIVYSMFREYLTIDNLSLIYTFLTLKNSYAKRIYKILNLYNIDSSTSSVDYSVCKFKRDLLLDNKYKKYSELKKRVITPAVKELNSIGCFKIEVIEIRKLRTVDSLIFNIEIFNDKIDLINKFLDITKDH